MNRRIRVQHMNDGSWVLLWRTSRMECKTKRFDTPQAVLNFVAGQDKRLSTKHNIVITTLEWLDAPEGFTPPTPRRPA
jgi:hypothetical protein